MEMQLREAIGFGSRSFFLRRLYHGSFSRWNFCVANRLFFAFAIRSAIQKDPRPFVM